MISGESGVTLEGSREGTSRDCCRDTWGFIGWHPAGADTGTKLALDFQARDRQTTQLDSTSGQDPSCSLGSLLVQLHSVDSLPRHSTSQLPSCLPR